MTAEGTKEVGQEEFHELRAAVAPGGCEARIEDDQPQAKKAKKLCDKKTEKKADTRSKACKEKSEEDKRFMLVKKVTRDMGIVSLELGRALQKLVSNPLEQARCQRMKELQQEMTTTTMSLGGMDENVEALTDDAKTKIAEAKRLIQHANSRV